MWYENIFGRFCFVLKIHHTISWIDRVISKMSAPLSTKKKQSTETKCDRCGKDFEIPSRLKRHQSRTTPCGVVIEDELPEHKKEYKHKCVCGRPFANEQMLHTHEKTCSYAKKAIATPASKQFVGESFKREAENRQMKKQLEELKAQLAELVKKSPHVKKGDGQENKLPIQEDNNKVVNINIFGKECQDLIHRQDLLRIINENVDVLDSRCELDRRTLDITIVAAALLFYSNTNQVENITSCMNNEEKGIALVHEKDGWRRYKTEQVIRVLVKNTINTIFACQPYETFYGIDETEDMKRATSFLSSLKAREMEIAGDPPHELATILIQNADFYKRELGRLPRPFEKFPPPDPSKRELPKYIRSFTVITLSQMIKKNPLPDVITDKYAEILFEKYSEYILDVHGNGHPSLEEMARERFVLKVRLSCHEPKEFKPDQLKKLGHLHKALELLLIKWRKNKEQSALSIDNDFSVDDIYS